MIARALALLFLVGAAARADSSTPAPKPTAGDAPLRLEDQVKLLIFKNGDLAVGDHRLSDAELERAVRARKANPPKVVIYADEAVRHERVVEVLDLLKRNGVTKMAIGVAAGK